MYHNNESTRQVSNRSKRSQSSDDQYHYYKQSYECVAYNGNVHASLFTLKNCYALKSIFSKFPTVVGKSEIESSELSQTTILAK